MKTYYKSSFSAFLLCAALFLTGCSDFFDPQTNDALPGDQYIGTQTEVYTGYLGVITKLQAVGDKQIFLTETRGSLIEPTPYSVGELIAIYNYDADLSGNSYADPAPYYELVIACNDYIDNMRTFREERPELVDVERFDALISLTLRVKVWAYLTLAEIYGEALWFDDPMVEIQSLKDTTRFKLMDIEEVVETCIDLLDNGSEATDFVNGTLEFSWYEWLDPETALADSQYRYWDYMTPPYEGLMARLLLWRGAFKQRAGGSIADVAPYYDKVAQLMLDYFNPIFLELKSNHYGQRNGRTPGNFSRFYDNVDPHAEEVVSAVIYDYTRNQTNRLLRHFSSEYPNEYLLRPNLQRVEEMFESNEFNPGAYNEGRTGATCGARESGKHYLAKFRPMGSSRRPYAYQDDVHIYLFRATEYHFYLVEALNQLARFDAADAILNNGIKAEHFVAEGGSMVKDDNGRGTPIDGFKSTTGNWKFTNDWTTEHSGGTVKYPSMGIRGCFGLSPRTIQRPSLSTETEEAKRGYMKHNDIEMLKEMQLEFAGEGKSYATMIRCAIRWNDPSIISNLVAPKYGERAAEMKPVIENQYFVPWDLNIK